MNSLRLRIVGVLLILASATLTTMSFDEEPKSESGVQEAAQSDAPWIVQAGDSLLDDLGRADLEHFPRFNLPRDMLARALEPFPMRSPEYRWGLWLQADVPYEERERYGIPDDVCQWRLSPDITPAADTQLIQVFYRESLDSDIYSPLKPWRRGVEEFPGIDVWWDQESGGLQALSRERPFAIYVDYWADPLAEFGGYERGLRASLQNEDFPPTPQDLLVYESLIKEDDGVMRPCVLLPAPSSIAFDIDRLDADSVEVYFGVVHRSFQRGPGDILERSSIRQSDGVELLVDVTVDGAVRGVFKSEVRRRGVGRGFRKHTVDLSAYRGRKVKLRFRTHPGGKDNSDFDYAVIGGLRFEDRRSVPSEQPNVVLIDIDTLRADRLQGYGSTRAVTPLIDEWAQTHATLYEDAVSTSSWTLPATASMLTGLAVHQHGVDTKQERLPEALPRIASILREAGYETYGVAEKGFLSPSYGFHVGFDHYDLSHFKDPSWGEALDWATSRKTGRPFFLFLHTYMVHAPFPDSDRFESPESPYRGPLRNRDVDYENVIFPFKNGTLDLDEQDRQHIGRLYDAVVYELDSIVGAFLNRLESELEGRELLVIFTSDHGEEFFEHGDIGHGHSLYDEVLKVPLIVRFPDRYRRGEVVTAPASILDIVPTILDCVGLPLADDVFLGRPLRRGEDEDPSRRVGQLTLDMPGSERVVLRSLHFRDYKFIESEGERMREEQVYFLPEDRDEKRNLAEDDPRLMRRLRERLDHVRRLFPPFTTSEKTSPFGGKLSELGYIH